MQRPREHRKALWAGQHLGSQAARVPEDHRLALVREHQRLQAERQRLQSELRVHRETLDRVRDQLAREREYYRVVYERNRWWIELALRWWEARRAA